MVHTIGIYYYDTPIHSLNWQIMNIYNKTTLWCVPVFVMISGIFFLDERQERTVKAVYIKQIPKIGIRLLLWSAIYCIVLQGTISVSGVLHTASSSHLWFLCIILVLYTITPVLRLILQRLNRYSTAIFTVAVFLTSFILYIYIYIGREDNKYYFIEVLCTEILRYIAYYLAGYYFSKYELKRVTRIIVYCCAILVILYTMVFIGITAKEQNTVIQITPTGDFGYFNFFSTVITVAVFILCKNICDRITFTASRKKKLRSIANLTFGIYLIHELLIHFLEKYIKHYLQPGFLYIPVISIAFFVLSAIVVFLIRKIPIFKKYLV